MKKKFKVNKSRKWLEKNKIFFEVFSFFFLGIASLLVTFFSYQSSQSQLEILKLEHSPIINIQREFKGAYESLEVNNVGYHLFELGLDCSSYFIIGNYKDSIVKKETDFYFKTKDYFGLNYETDNTTGNIGSIYSSPYTNKDKKRIIDECKTLFGSNYENGYFEHLLRVLYKDERKEIIYKYFKIDAFSIIEVSKRKYDEIIDRYNVHYNLIGNRYLNKMKASSINEDIEKIYNEIIIFDELKDSDI